MPIQPSVLIAGASSGMDATYADRFARRGHDPELRGTAQWDAYDAARKAMLLHLLGRASGGALSRSVRTR